MSFVSRTKMDTITSVCSELSHLSDASHGAFSPSRLGRQSSHAQVAVPNGRTRIGMTGYAAGSSDLSAGRSETDGKMPDDVTRFEDRTRGKSSLCQGSSDESEVSSDCAGDLKQSGLRKMRRVVPKDDFRAFCEGDTLAENEINTSQGCRKFEEKISLVKIMLSSPETEDDAAVSESAMVRRMTDENARKKDVLSRGEPCRGREITAKGVFKDGADNAIRDPVSDSDEVKGVSDRNDVKRGQNAEAGPGADRHDASCETTNRTNGHCIEAVDLSMEETALIEISGKPVLTESAPMHTPMPSQELEESCHRGYFSEIEIGCVVAQRYEILSEIARGGYGIVYRARQLGVDRIVALKRLRSQSDPSVVQRFMCEMQMIKNLVHPNTIQLIDAGMDDRHMFIVMEYIEGESLHQILKKEKRLTLDRAIHIIRQVLKSVNEAHQRGIIHRDIKPSNILIRKVIGEADFVKVLDFGIAKSKDTAGMKLTRTGHVMGTPHYLAPESMMFGEHCYQSDIFAIGLIFYEMLTGQQVLNGTLSQITQLLASEKPIPVPNAYEGTPLSHVLRKALAKNPGDRYATAGDMIRDIDILEREMMRANGMSAVYCMESRSPMSRFIILFVVIFALNLCFWIYVALID